MYQCDDCDQTFQGEPTADPYTFQGNQYGTCPDCVKTKRDGLIRTPARLDKTGRYAWPGGYPLAFYGEHGGIVLCFDCARESLENGDDPLHAEIEDGDQAYYGGVHCDACNAEIVTPQCPECANDLHDGSPLLFSESVDASMMHRKCAAELVVRHCRASRNDGTEHPTDIRAPHARRIPGVGIEIMATKPLEYGWDNGSPWYARSGTIYRYPNR